MQRLSRVVAYEADCRAGLCTDPLECLSSQQEGGNPPPREGRDSSIWQQHLKRHLHLGSPGGAAVKNPLEWASRRQRRWFGPWSGRLPRERLGGPLQHSRLHKSTGRGAWRATVRRVTKSVV